MASNYKLSKAEFGLRSYSIALPGVPEDVLQDNSAHQVVKSRSFDLQPGEKTTGTSIKQKLKGWLTRGSSKNKTEKGEKRVNEQPATAHRESPLHKRLWLSGKTNDTPTEVEEAKAQGSPSLVKLSMKRRDSNIFQVTLRTNRRGLGMLYSAGLPPITVIFVERGGQAEDAGVKIGDILLSVNGVDCFNPNLSISQLMEIKAMINQTNEKTVAGTTESAGTQEPTKKEDTTIVRSKSVSNPLKSETANTLLQNSLKSETEDKLSQASSDLDLTNIDSDSETATQNPGSAHKPNKEKSNTQIHSSLLKAHTKESEPLILKVALENEDEKSDEEADLQKPSLSIKDGSNITSSYAKEVDLQDISKLKPTLGVKDGSNLTLFPSSAKEADLQDIPKLKPSLGLEDDKRITQSFSLVEEIDLTNIPKLKPSLGLKDGHSRRDIVTRRQRKHRPATNRHTLLLDSDEAAWMGTTRVEVPTSTPVKIAITEDSNSQTDIKSEIHARADESENQAKIQHTTPKHQSPHTENLNELYSGGGILSANDFRSRSGEAQPKINKISFEEGTSAVPRNERLNPIPELRKRTSLGVANTKGTFPLDLEHRNLGSIQRKRQSLDAELYLTAITKESPMTSAQQAGPGDGPAVCGPTNRQSTISSERTNTLKDISGPEGNSTALSNTNTMKRARSYTICSTTALKDSKESKSASKTNSPGSATTSNQQSTKDSHLTATTSNQQSTKDSHLTATTSNQQSTKDSHLTATTSNQQSTNDSLLPKQGLVKARMAMFQKQ